MAGPRRLLQLACTAAAVAVVAGQASQPQPCPYLDLGSRFAMRASGDCSGAPNSGPCRAQCAFGYTSPPGSAYSFNCNLNSNNNISTWSASVNTITCRKDCPRPTAANSGLGPFASLPPSAPPTYTFGQSVTPSEITCATGYHDAGTTTFTCNADGSWNGTAVCVPTVTFRAAPNSAFQAPTVLTGTTTVAWERTGGTASATVWPTGNRTQQNGLGPVWPANPTTLTQPGDSPNFVVRSGVGGTALFYAQVRVQSATLSVTSFNPTLQSVASQTTNAVSKDENFQGSFSAVGGSGYYTWTGFEDTVVTSLEQTAFGGAADVVNFVQATGTWQARGTFALGGLNTLPGGAVVELVITVTDLLWGTSASFQTRLESTDSISPTVNGDTVIDTHPNALDSVFRFNRTEGGAISLALNAIGVQTVRSLRRCTIVSATARRHVRHRRDSRLSLPAVHVSSRSGRARRQTVNETAGIAACSTNSTSRWLSRFNESCQGFFLTPPGTSEAGAHVCTPACSAVLSQAHPDYTPDVDVCVEYLYLTDVTSPGRFPGHGVLRNYSIQPQYAQFTAATLVQALFAYPTTCKAPERAVPGGLSLGGPNNCSLTGVLSNNGPWQADALEPTGRAPNEFYFVVTVEASDRASFPPSSTTQVNVTLLMRVFSPLEIEYSTMQRDASGVAVGTVNNDTDFVTFLTISGGQTPYTVPTTPLLPCGIRLRTTYELSSPMNCSTFTSTPARLAGADAATLAMQELFVRDGNDVQSVAPNISLRRGPDDCANAAYGPNSQTCAQNAPCVDTDKFDGSFSCDCSGLGKTEGPNCAFPESSTDNSGGIAAGVTVALFVVIGVLVVAYVLNERRKAKMVPFDFESQLQDLVNKGVIKLVTDKDGKQIEQAKIPTELDRNDVCPLDVLGAGEFGEVYKALYTSKQDKSADGSSGGDYSENYQVVAVKTLKGVKGEVNREEKETLMCEATITAQFDHPNIVKLVGVVTAGTPLMIVLEICNYGELKKMVSKFELEPDLKVSLMLGIARGMEHLSGLGYIHRDLAARNVLVSEDRSNCESDEDVGDFVPKIADFGLAKDTEQSDYYVAKSAGKIPIRWTAPEALQKRKFGEKSDVWAFGIVCYELWSDGRKPYKQWSNAIVTEQVTLNRYRMGYDQFKKYDCPQDLFILVIEPCWEFETRSRPTFKQLVARLDAYEIDGSNEEAVAAAEESLAASGEAGSDEPDEIPPSPTPIASFPSNKIEKILDERLAIPFFWGGLSSDKTDDVLMTMRGDTRNSSDNDTTSRRVYILREVDETTLVLSCMINGIIGHQVMDYVRSAAADASWMERVDPMDTSKGHQAPLGYVTNNAVTNLLRNYKLLDAEGLCNPKPLTHAGLTRRPPEVDAAAHAGAPAPTPSGGGGKDATVRNPAFRVSVENDYVMSTAGMFESSGPAAGAPCGFISGKGRRCVKPAKAGSRYCENHACDKCDGPNEATGSVCSQCNGASPNDADDIDVAVLMRGRGESVAGASAKPAPAPRRDKAEPEPAKRESRREGGKTPVETLDGGIQRRRAKTGEFVNVVAQMRAEAQQGQQKQAVEPAAGQELLAQQGGGGGGGGGDNDHDSRVVYSAVEIQRTADATASAAGSAPAAAAAGSQAMETDGRVKYTLVKPAVAAAATNPFESDDDDDAAAGGDTDL